MAKDTSRTRMPPAQFVATLHRRRQSNVFIRVLVMVLVGCGVAAVVGVVFPTAWSVASLSGVLVAFLLAFLGGGGIIPAGAVLWWYFKAPQHGLFSSIGRTWVVSIVPEAMVLHFDDLATEIAWSAIQRAEWVWWDQWEHVQGIEDVIWLHLHDGVVVPVPESAVGFEAFRVALTARLSLTSRSVEL